MTCTTGCACCPGITGMWQVSGRSETTFDEYKRLDLYYVDNWSLAHDARIVLRTVLGRDGPPRRPLTRGAPANGAMIDPVDGSRRVSERALADSGGG